MVTCSSYSCTWFKEELLEYVYFPALWNRHAEYNSNVQLLISHCVKRFEQKCNRSGGRPASNYMLGRLTDGRTWSLPFSRALDAGERRPAVPRVHGRWRDGTQRPVCWQRRAEIYLMMLLFRCYGVSDCDPMDCSLPGASVHGILQARILEWVAISFSRVSSWPRDRICISCIGRQVLYLWATGEAIDLLALLFPFWYKSIKCKPQGAALWIRIYISYPISH